MNLTYQTMVDLTSGFSDLNSWFLSPQAMKNVISPPMHTKSSDNFNVLHMFNNNTYTVSEQPTNMS